MFALPCLVCINLCLAPMSSVLVSVFYVTCFLQPFLSGSVLTEAMKMLTGLAKSFARVLKELHTGSTAMLCDKGLMSKGFARF